MTKLLYNSSDPDMEDALYENETMRRFAGLRLSNNLPDETTILNFRHFLEKHKFGKCLFETIQRHLAGQGLRLQEGSPEAALEKEKASVRVQVEHAFFYIKRMFGYNKIRNRGLEKNMNRLYMLAGFTNLLRAERYMAR